MKVIPFLGALGMLFVLPACDNPDRMLRALQDDISAYAASPTPAEAENIQAGFARLDGEITRLRYGGNTAEARSLARQTDSLRAQFAAAQVTAGLQKAGETVRGVGEAFRQAGQSIGEVFKGDADGQD
jgi:hypothetical protein